MHTHGMISGLVYLLLTDFSRKSHSIPSGLWQLFEIHAILLIRRVVHSKYGGSRYGRELSGITHIAEVLLID